MLAEAGFDLRELGRLVEAAQPMETGLEVYVALGDWTGAACVANNLSELCMTVGDLAKALAYAEQSVDLSDRGGDVFDRLSNRTTLADALHQAGRVEKAESLLREAEQMQRERRSDRPVLDSVGSFRYCDLLLTQGNYEHVQRRATQTLEWATAQGWSLLAVALDHLSLGRAHLLKALHEETGDYGQAAEHVARAVDGLRQAGTQHQIPRGLLSRAELRRVRNDFDRARRDLDEAMSIAERGGMGLYQADAYLGYARLYLATGDKDSARESLRKARKMVKHMGYHRRDGEVEELEAQLGV